MSSAWVVLAGAVLTCSSPPAQARGIDDLEWLIVFFSFLFEDTSEW